MLVINKNIYIEVLDEKYKDLNKMVFEFEVIDWNHNCIILIILQMYK